MRNKRKGEKKRRKGFDRIEPLVRRAKSTKLMPKVAS